MSGTWKPKHQVKCNKCGWTGKRAIISKSCPKCGHWHPMRTDREMIMVLWHPEGKPMLASNVRTTADKVYAMSKAGDWWLLSRPSPDGWRAPVLKIKREFELA